MNNKTKTIIVILLFIIGFGFLTASVLFKYNKPEEKESTNNKKDEKKENDILLDIDADSEKLKKFIDTAFYDFNQAGHISYTFLGGIDKLDDITKYSLAIYGSNMKDITEENLPEKYKDTETGQYLMTLPNHKYITFDDFNKTFNYLFNEDYDPEILKNSIKNDGTNEETITTCPHLYLYDEDNKMIILSSHCGGVNSYTLHTKTYDYKIDDSYIYIYQYAGYSQGYLYQKLDKSNVNVSSFDGNEDKFSTLIWKFDLNYNFISTEVKS